MQKMLMTYDNPVEAVFQRMLAWETVVAGQELKVKEAEMLLQIARQELGLSPLQGGAAQDFLQKLRDLNPAGLLNMFSLNASK